jgi:hypothetical protein
LGRGFDNQHLIEAKVAQDILVNNTGAVAAA